MYWYWVYSFACMCVVFSAHIAIYYCACIAIQFSLVQAYSTCTLHLHNILYTVHVCVVLIPCTYCCTVYT